MHSWFSRQSVILTGVQGTHDRSGAPTCAQGTPEFHGRSCIGPRPPMSAFSGPLSSIIFRSLGSFRRLGVTGDWWSTSTDACAVPRSLGSSASATSLGRSFRLSSGTVTQRSWSKSSCRPDGRILSPRAQERGLQVEAPENPPCKCKCDFKP